MKSQYEIDYQQGYDKANEEWLDRMDKIRAEIEQKIVRRSGLSHTRSERDRNDAFLEVLDVIDKYRKGK